MTSSSIIRNTAPADVFSALTKQVFRSFAANAMLEILFAELVEYLGKASSRYAKIATLGKQKLSKEEIIAELGLKSSRGYQEIDKAKKLAEKFLYEL